MHQPICQLNSAWTKFSSEQTLNTRRLI